MVGSKSDRQMVRHLHGWIPRPLHDREELVDLYVSWRLVHARRLATAPGPDHVPMCDASGTAATAR